MVRKGGKQNSHLVNYLLAQDTLASNRFCFMEQQHKI